MDEYFRLTNVHYRLKNSDVGHTLIHSEFPGIKRANVTFAFSEILALIHYTLYYL